MTTTRDLSDTHVAAAIRNYEEAGKDNLPPVLILVGGIRKAIAMMILDENAPIAVGLVLAGLGSILEPTHAVFVSETWTRSYAPDQAVDLRRGQLARLAGGGDTSVHTAVVVSVWNLGDIDDSLTVLVDMDDPDRDRLEMPGRGEGAIADYVQAVVKVLPAAVAARPPDATLTQMISALGDYVAGVAVEMRPGEELPPGAEVMGAEWN